MVINMILGFKLMEENGMPCNAESCPIEVQSNLVITRSSGPEKLPPYIETLLYQG